MTVTLDRPASTQASPSSTSSRPYPWYSDPIVWSVFVASFTAFLWVRGGGPGLLLSGGHGTWLAVGQVTGLAAALGALAGLVLVARPSWLERREGLDRLVAWHRLVGIGTVVALLCHVVCSTTGFAGGSLADLPEQVAALVRTEAWMVAALGACLLFLLIALTSWHRIKMHLPYETWYFLHLTGYLAVLLGFGHQLTVGTDFVADSVAFWFWVLLFVAVFALVGTARLGGLARSVSRGRIEVAAVEPAARGTVAITVSGPGLARISARAGQFFCVRFLTRQMWWQSHPFSVSSSPASGSLRFTVKNLGDASAAMQFIAPGTGIKLQGPYGRMCAKEESDREVLLIGAGVGLAPMRAILEDCTLSQRPTVVARAHSIEEVPHLAELRALVAQRGGQLFLALGSRRRWPGGNPFTAEQLRTAVPDICDRGAFVCGPPALQAAVEQQLRRAGVDPSHIHSERFGW